MQYISSVSKESNDTESEELLWNLLKISIKNHGNLNHPEALKSIRELLSSSNPSSSILSDSSSFHEESLVSQLQQILISKSLEEAHLFAVENKLWSHALVLAHQINVETVKTTIQKFSEFSLLEGSPLRTNYLLTSGNPNGLRKELFFYFLFQ